MTEERMYRLRIASVIHEFATAEDLRSKWTEITEFLTVIQNDQRLNSESLRSRIVRTLRYLEANEVGCVRYELFSLFNAIKSYDDS